MPRDFLPIIREDILQNPLEDQGTVLSDTSKVTEVGCAHIARHRDHGCAEWKIFVVDDHGNRIMEVPLPTVPDRSIRSRSWLPSFSFNSGSRSTHIVAWSMVALAIVVLADTIVSVANRGVYETASAPTNEAIVAVRFIAQVTAEDITAFLETYNGNIIDVPRPGGFYRVRIAGPTLSQEELKKVAARMAQDKVVEMIAVPQ
jgi:hypothetical protein